MISLELLQRRTFRKVDFTETADGHCRLMAPLTHELATSMPRWSKALAPITEKMAHTLGQAMTGKYLLATPLTRDSQRKAQALVKARKKAALGAAKSTTNRQRRSRIAPPPWNCPDCGGPVTNHQHVRCDACIAADPHRTLELRGRRGAAIAARKRAQRHWELACGGNEVTDPAVKVGEDWAYRKRSVDAVTPDAIERHDELLALRAEVRRLAQLVQTAITALEDVGNSKVAKTLSQELGVPIETIRAGKKK